MKTKRINTHTPGPLFVGTPIRSADTVGICKTWNDSGETGEDTIAEVLPGMPGCAKRDARLLASAYTAFDRAGRALGIDAAELAESVDLAGLIQAAHHLLTNAESVSSGQRPNGTTSLRAELSVLPMPATD